MQRTNNLAEIGAEIVALSIKEAEMIAVKINDQEMIYEKRKL